MLSVLFIIIGAVLVLWGADRLTDGATSLAQKMNVPQIVIGLTVVAMGTSMPEFFVSLMSAIKGTSDMAVGNVIGSNVFNTLAIVGITALVAPMLISPSTVRKDMPFAVVASVALLLMCRDGEVSRLDAAILFVGFGDLLRDRSGRSMLGQCIGKGDSAVLGGGIVCHAAHQLRKGRSKEGRKLIFGSTGFAGQCGKRSIFCHGTKYRIK